VEKNEHFQLAEVSRDKKIEEMLTEFENKLGQHIGGDVVLIAYKRNKDENAWH
jgi:tetrahydromethanopterin S-methyltransferase subunit G